MKRLIPTLIVTALLALGAAGPALAWEQCTAYRVRDPSSGRTRHCDLCCRNAGPDTYRRVCQWICYN